MTFKAKDKEGQLQQETKNKLFLHLYNQQHLTQLFSVGGTYGHDIYMLVQIS